MNHVLIDECVLLHGWRLILNVGLELIRMGEVGPNVICNNGIGLCEMELHGMHCKCKASHN